jgi:uncharacterized membrane protein YidH (DUF202 family)
LQHAFSRTNCRHLQSIIGLMADRTQPRLDLPSAALHAPAHREPHVDSDDAVQYEHQRVSRELGTIYHGYTSKQSLKEAQTLEASPSYASLRSRNASLRDSTTSSKTFQRVHSDVISTSTQPDIPSASDDSGRSFRTLTRISHWHDLIIKFWKAHVSLTIEEGAHRDHLGMQFTMPTLLSHIKSLNTYTALERTFLGYLRTSLILVVTGVTIAQLFHLQHAPNANRNFGFYVIGRPLSVIFNGMAILMILIGAYRFWRLQHGLVRGKAYAGGWEILLIMGLSAVVSKGY